MTANITFIHDRQAMNTTPSIEGESQELIDVLQKIVQNTGVLLDVQNCSVALLDEKQTSLVTLAALQKHGQLLRQTRFHFNEGVAGWVAEHREALIINDVSLDPRFKRLGRMPIGSIICVPLIEKSNFIGTITASSSEINAFDEKKVSLLSIFADQAVLAITNARHAQIALHQAQQLEMLMHLSRDITTSLKPEALYHTILSDVGRLVSCDLALIYLYQQGKQELYPVAEASPGQDASDPQIKTADVQREHVSLFDTRSVAALAAAHRHPMLHMPAQNEQDVAELAAPFVSKGALYGVLSLKRARPFDSEELRLVRNLSHMAAAALENTVLFQEVRADQEQLRTILTSSSDGIALLDSDNCFIEANTAFGHIFRMEPEQILGMEWRELLSWGDDEVEPGRGISLIQQALQNKQTLPYVEIDLTIQEASRSLGLSITPITSVERPLFLLMARDVTSIRDATRMKANFLSMITHELRSPLNAINGYLDLALEGIGGELNPQQRDFMQRARAGSEHLFALIEDLLLASRADSGQLRLAREIISLQNVIVNAVEEMEVNARDLGISINVEIAKDFPRLYADAGRLQQVLRNLISNALRFTPSKGQVTVSAWVETLPSASDEDETRVVKLQVSDTGNGIASEHQERIFERFYQVPGNSSARGGQGLGLSVVQMIVELHGGSITVDSIPGHGSTFTCTLPCLLT